MKSLTRGWSAYRLWRQRRVAGGRESSVVTVESILNSIAASFWVDRQMRRYGRPGGVESGSAHELSFVPFNPDSASFSIEIEEYDHSFGILIFVADDVRPVEIYSQPREKTPDPIAYASEEALRVMGLIADGWAYEELEDPDGTAGVNIFSSPDDAARLAGNVRFFAPWAPGRAVPVDIAEGGNEPREV